MAGPSQPQLSRQEQRRYPPILSRSAQADWECDRHARIENAIRADDGAALDDHIHLFHARPNPSHLKIASGLSRLDYWVEFPEFDVSNITWHLVVH